MTKKPRILIATHNKGKVAEIKKILKPIEEIEFVGLHDLKVTEDYEEKGSTFTENATAKALFYSNLLELPALADDSGLVIDALDGEPGIHSARYLGSETNYETKMKDILNRLEGKKTEDRAASFVCSMCFVMNGEIFATTVKRTFGYITEELIGTEGFGYDPIFFSPELNSTFAIAGAARKNITSHRAKAVRALSHLFECNENLRESLGLKTMISN
jgi:XTP/dITP diphosphohydrolase